MKKIFYIILVVLLFSFEFHNLSANADNNKIEVSQKKEESIEEKKSIFCTMSIIKNITEFFGFCDNKKHSLSEEISDIKNDISDSAKEAKNKISDLKENLESKIFDKSNDSSKDKK
jgi:hypothetical protein